eukprot:CAMPEP_0172497676 /NCGR_PEP_ID=MMETSP1066-20121228/103263_1 /TAXON_ID=671091 /ORGANISM="Coscinodiscus wailesii, Strain CCMP2513" /LENGTH=178 /DNA_ID=CAMNT_0013270577 /DNA_START=48 /DNA_END=580 /DNA_ORIENTATION=+
MTIKINNERMAQLRSCERRGPLHLNTKEHDSCLRRNVKEPTVFAPVVIVSGVNERHTDFVNNKGEFRSSSPTCVSGLVSEPQTKVWFADPIVTEVRTRPITLESDISKLFYSSSETLQFRRNYYEWLHYGKVEDDVNNQLYVETGKVENELESCRQESEQGTSENMMKHNLISKVTVS